MAIAKKANTFFHERNFSTCETDRKKNVKLYHIFLDKSKAINA